MKTPEELIQIMRCSSSKQVFEKLQSYYAMRASDTCAQRQLNKTRYEVISDFFEQTKRDSQADGWSEPAKEKKEIVLPSWEACRKAESAGKTSALQYFLYRWEPMRDKGFRSDLLAALKEVAP